MDDIVIVGGGIIGAATAYFLSKEGRKVKVIERDPTYKKASFPLSLGGFRRQFYQKENILLGKFAREFISQIPEILKTFDLGKYPANEELVSGSIKDILSPTSTFNFLASNLPKTILLSV